MCGIVGVVGNTNATDILIQGLEKLEYRGYDSAGIFVLGGAENHLVKAVGRIAELSAKTAGVEGTTGIGHTRWATHGKPTEDNAHPHRSETERFVLVCLLYTSRDYDYGGPLNPLCNLCFDHSLGELSDFFTS